MSPTTTSGPVAAPKKPAAPVRPTSISTKTPGEIAAAQSQYGRGKGASGSMRDKKLRGNMKKLELRYREAATQAKDAEILRPEAGPGFIEAEGELERTWKVGQKEVRGAVDVATATKGFALELGFGPYVAEYSRDGRDLVIAGRKGHVATFDWREGKIGCELQLGETVRDVKWLHNEHFFAVAQKKYVYIYDQQGTEIHCLKKHIEVTAMEFLPYHFLLATIGNAGYLKYQDTSTGQLITEQRTKLGAATAMAQNRRNAIIHVGHGNGSVTLWSPSMSTPLVTMLTNKGPVRSIAMDRGGYYMATAGADSRMNIFDIRTFKEVHSYFTPTPASTLAISDTGVLGVGWGGGHVTLWKDALKTKQASPYMSHHQESASITNLRFCPYDDVLGVGHSKGFSSLIVPGAGEPNFDALEANPYATKKARQEGEVRALLEKLRPEMIQLDPDFVGKVDLASGTRKKERDDEAKERALKEGLEKDEKYKTRGRNSALRKFMRKKGGKNVRDERREKLERLKVERMERNKGIKKVEMGAALDRFTGLRKKM